MAIDLSRRLAASAVALLCFAGNSLLCRAALAGPGIDPGAFTLVRMVCGALMLALLVRLRGARATARTGWGSAVALVGYAFFFSFAYRRVDTGVGALLLFGAVQVTMIGASVARGERAGPGQWLGLVAALAGLVWLTVPGKAAPDPIGALRMAVAGFAWGVYSLRGRAAGDALAATAESFVRGTALTIPLALATLSGGSVPFVTGRGVLLAALSGAVTSGLGYSVWYAVLPSLTRHRAAVLQLLVPILAAIGGVVLLGEPVNQRLWIAGALVLGGVALSVRPTR